jgi:hypothetical protein
VPPASEGSVGASATEADYADVFSARWPWWLGRPTADFTYALYARAYALATLLRLSLPDAMQWSWLPATLVQGAGAVLLLANGCMLGWLLCAVGALWGIVALQDQLTQSAYLLACASAALLCFVPAPGQREERLALGLPHAVRLLTLLVYAAAALHKLNHDFLDPAVSCANAGLSALATRGQVESLLDATLMASPLWPALFVAVELSLPVLAWRRPGVAVVALATFHLPLTIIFAPGFAFTMMSGWVCLLDEPQLRGLVRVWQRRWPRILVAGGVPALASRLLFFPGRWASDPDWCIKEVALWLVLAWLLEAVTTRWPDRRFATRGAWANDVAGRWVGRAAALAFVAHALSPYFGLGFHRTGAMLSNLRIDPGCHNSLLVPEALRVVNPFVHVRHVGFASGRAAPGFDEQVERRLWSLTSLWRARTHWCATHLEPLPVVVEREGEVFEIANLCAADGWPFPRPWLSGLRRYQINLTADCPQACIH